MSSFGVLYYFLAVFISGAFDKGEKNVFLYVCESDPFIELTFIFIFIQ